MNLTGSFARNWYKSLLFEKSMVAKCSFFDLLFFESLNLYFAFPSSQSKWRNPVWHEEGKDVLWTISKSLTGNQNIFFWSFPEHLPQLQLFLPGMYWGASVSPGWDWCQPWLHFSEYHTDYKAANLWTLKESSYSENFIRWYLVFLQNEQ